MYCLPGIVISTAVIWFSVSVPVLSELIAEVEPSVSVERSRFTIAFAFASICVPYERIVVTTAGSPVGIAAIAKAIAAVNTVLKEFPRERFRATEMTRERPARTRICFVSLSSCRVSGVLASSSLCRRSEMCPTSVCMPVAVTTKSPAPRVTFVFM